MPSLTSCTRAAAIVLAAGIPVHASQKSLNGGHSDSSGNPLTKDFGRYAHELLDVYHVPGIAIGVVDGEEIYTEGYGIATLPDALATSDTLWYGASTSKAQAAAILSQLIASKNYTELSQGWSTPISSIIRDDFVLADDYATAHVTLDDAASHRTGMGTHDLAAPDYVDGRPAVPRDWVRNMRNLRMTSEPRTKFVYCNFMFVALSHVIETVTGRWLGDLLRERIWGPLGMKATYFELSDALDAPEHFANGYAWNSTAEKFERIEYMNVTAVTGAGAVISNVKDYAKWVRCLINGGGPLSEEVRKDIMTPRSIMSDTPGGGVDVTLYGAGWMRTTFHGRVLYHHSGGMHAYGAEVYWLPDDKFGVVSFGNTATTSNHVQEILIYRLMEEKLGIPAEHRYDLDSERRQAVKKSHITREQAIEKLFPDLPEKRLTSPFEIDQLTGLYEDAGYGKMPLRVGNSAENEDEKVLIADRAYMTFRHKVVLEHISGDYWMAKYNIGEKSEIMMQYFAAKVVGGVDGKPSAWETKMSTSADEPGDGTVIWKKVE